MAEKVCTECGKSKSLSDFYRRRISLDGHYTKCKECMKSDARKNRKANLAHYQEYDRARSQTSERKTDKRKREREKIATAVGRRKEWDRLREFRRRNPQKRAIYTKIRNAIRAGKIIPDPCHRCGAEKTEAHHEDYSRPFEVIWLCKSCHGARHREKNEEERRDGRHTPIV